MGGKHDIVFPAFGDFPTIAVYLSLRPVGTAQRPEVRGWVLFDVPAGGCNA